MSVGGSSSKALGSLPPLPTLANDPTFALLKEKSQLDQVEQLSAQARADSASLMARYGTRLALTNGTTDAAKSNALIKAA